MNAKILIVDDLKTDVLLISSMLSDCELLCASDGLEAMEIIQSAPGIDLIILDLNMPKMDGFEVLKALKSDPDNSKISVIILTNYDEIENEIKGLDLGAVDYIRKPLNMASMRKRVEVHLNLRRAQVQIEEQNKLLELTVYNRTKELIITRDITIRALVGLLEVRNIESSNHAKRTQHMMKALCEHLKDKLPFKEVLLDEYVTELCKTASLHDIGKVGIPDSILLKPGKLDFNEFEKMKNHTTFGVLALSHDLPDGVAPSFIKTAIEIVGGHHERYDGSGYPKNLAGRAIPLGGRLMAVIDVYDALTHKRVYKEAYSHEFALELIENEKGKQFDPDIVTGFLEIGTEILEISRQFDIENLKRSERLENIKTDSLLHASVIDI
jgi:putative two-component system response regulator